MFLNQTFPQIRKCVCGFRHEAVRGQARNQRGAIYPRRAPRAVCLGLCLRRASMVTIAREHAHPSASAARSAIVQAIVQDVVCEVEVLRKDPDYLHAMEVTG